VNTGAMPMLFYALLRRLRPDQSTGFHASVASPALPKAAKLIQQIVFNTIKLSASVVSLCVMSACPKPWFSYGCVMASNRDRWTSSKLITKPVNIVACAKVAGPGSATD
jgi:hypothetical protein